MGVTNVDWSHELLTVHEPDQTLNLVINVTKTSRLGSISIHCDWFASQSL